MHSVTHLIPLAALVVMIASPTARAQEVERLPGSPTMPFVPGVMVPAGFNTYYFTGATAAVANASASKGSYESYGDISIQTRSALDSLKASLAIFGLTFADVVQARVFMSRDPSKNGGIDFAAMSRVWATEFGSPAQPNKPVRTSVEVAGLISPGLLVEIEMTAAKKAESK